MNRIEAGKDYGWPTVEGASDDPRFVDPLATWADLGRLPQRGRHRRHHPVRRVPARRAALAVPLHGRPHRRAAGRCCQGEYGRLRAVAVAPDGSLWVLTSNHDGRGNPTGDDDRILR